MNEYHKINSVFKRDPETKHKTLLIGEYAEDEFTFLKDNIWLWTEKVDGTNIRVMIPGGAKYSEGWMGNQIRFGGKTDNAQIPAFLLDRLRERFDPLTEGLNAEFPDGACLYGEGYGARIQKGGGDYRPDQDFVLFDVKVGHWWLKRDAIEEIAYNFELDIVPVIGAGNIPEMVELVKAGFNSTWGPFLAEGVVARPAVDLITRGGRRIITKLKHKDFHPIER